MASKTERHILRHVALNAPRRTTCDGRGNNQKGNDQLADRFGLTRCRQWVHLCTRVLRWTCIPWIRHSTSRVL
jgi:hypothetical protein